MFRESFKVFRGVADGFFDGFGGGEREPRTHTDRKFMVWGGSGSGWLAGTGEQGELINRL